MQAGSTPSVMVGYCAIASLSVMLMLFVEEYIFLFNQNRNNKKSLSSVGT